MGTVAFVMLVAGGYANVVRETGAVEELVDAAMLILGGSRLLFVIVLLFIGLLITMGIGTSFGTIPVIALLYVPMCSEMGISVGATACLIACAAALGDAGSPASDSTLGPTAGLNADGVTTFKEPYKSRNHTELMLEYLGADIQVKGNEVFIKNGEGDNPSPV